MGSVEIAKTLIYEASKAGADMVKMQAIDANVVARIGSMPKSFYESCELTTEQYLSCAQYGRTVGVPVFFSIFGTKHAVLNKVYKNSLHKISGEQFRQMDAESLMQWSNHRTIVSIPMDLGDLTPAKARAIWPMQKMMVGPYPPGAMRWEYMEHAKGLFPRIGYSDHTPGIEACKVAIKRYGCELIEKHFHLGAEIVWEGVKYRDCLHAARPEQFSELTKFFKSLIKKDN